MATLRFNEETARKLQEAYSTEDVIAQRRATLARLALLSGEAVLDVGCGPGFLCEQMAMAVGKSGRVLGLDVSEELLSFARGRSQHDWLTYRQGDATALDVEDGSFDVAVSTQVMEYVDDVDRALSELHRVLRPGGRVLIVDTDWDGVVWHSDQSERMARIKTAWEEHCADPRLPRTLVPRLRAAGFAAVQVTGYPIINTSLEPGTLSGALIGLVADFLARRGTVPPDEIAGWAAELRSLDADGRYFFSLLRCLFLAVKPRGGTS
jgi:arsenite methyltransferase